MTYGQITGRIVDINDGQPISSATVVYKDGSNISITDSIGQFQIARIDNGILYVSSIGYESCSYIIKKDTPNEVLISLAPIHKTLDEVVISGKKTRYKRKGNPAVELMRKVIESKNVNGIYNYPNCRYTIYKKIMGGLNDLQSKDLNQGIFENRPWLRDNLEISSYNGKLVMPVTMEETVSHHYYRKQPKSEKDVIIAHNISGINTLFQTGDIFNIILNEYFSDIDIYEDYVKLFNNSFCSPIGRDAISFYHYYISDTLMMDSELCFQVDFTPSNKQDFGFCGQLYILADSSYQVKKCEMSIPLTSDVNWINGMKSVTEYTTLENGLRAKVVDDMMVELMVTKFTAKAIVIRNTFYSDYSFEQFSDTLYKRELKNRNLIKDDTFWQKHRKTPLTNSESALDSLVFHIENQHGAKSIIFALRGLTENYIETGTMRTPSKFDVGPVFSTFTQNIYDGWRFRIGGQTTANLNSHLFFKGYYAYATRSHQNYYDGKIIYTFNKPKYLPHEFPKRTISFEVMRDVAFSSDRFLSTDKDNLFTSLKINKVDKMFLYERQSMNIQYETMSGLCFNSVYKHENVRPIKNILFSTLSSFPHTINKSLTISEITLGVSYYPGQTYLNSKQERWSMNYDTPVISIQHIMGFKGFCGGEYNYHHTEVEFGKRFWLPINLGNINTNIRLGAQWSQVPFPLLLMPATNVTYIIEPNTFDLINDMEFLNDRYISLQLGWDLNGKLFNMIPLLKKTKCREYIGLKCLWGGLTDKNNPYAKSNQASDVLFAFPEGCYVMDWNKPYWEMSFGIHNIFNLLNIQYIKRLSYNELPSTKSNVLKFTLEFKF